MYNTLTRVNPLGATGIYHFIVSQRILVFNPALKKQRLLAKTLCVGEDQHQIFFDFYSGFREEIRGELK